MKSTDKIYLHGVDHLRAVAAILVFYWHSIHRGGVDPLYIPENIFLGFMEEGYTGVGLFITITGFIFSFIIGDKDIDYVRFLYNRFIRIFPLLFIVSFFGHLVGEQAKDDLTLLKFFNLFGGGTFFGSWTLVIEFQFYLFFPIIFIHFRKRFKGCIIKYLPYFVIITIGMIFRLLYYAHEGTFQSISYSTIFGRIDQFMFGVIAYFSLNDINRHIKSVNIKRIVAFILLIVSSISLVCFYNEFNKAGGYYNMPSYPSPNAIWFIVPTIDGVLYGTILVSWVLLSSGSHNYFSRFMAYLGAISYSTYLLHIPIIVLCNEIISKYQIVFHGNKFVDRNLIVFFLVYPVVLICSSLSFEFIEKPFLDRRIKYTK